MASPSTKAPSQSAQALLSSEDADRDQPSSPVQPRDRGSDEDDEIAYGNTDDDNDISSQASSRHSADNRPNTAPEAPLNHALLAPLPPQSLVDSPEQTSMATTPPDHLYVPKKRPRRNSNNSSPIRIRVGRNCANPAACIVFKRLLPIAPVDNAGTTTTIINTFRERPRESDAIFDHSPPRPIQQRQFDRDIVETRVFSNEDKPKEQAVPVQTVLPSLRTSLSTPSPSPSPTKRKRAVTTSLCVFDHQASGYIDTHPAFRRSQAPSPSPAQRSKTTTGVEAAHSQQHTSGSWSSWKYPALPQLYEKPLPHLDSSPPVCADTILLANKSPPQEVNELASVRFKEPQQIHRRPSTSPELLQPPRPFLSPVIQTSVSEGHNSIMNRPMSGYSANLSSSPTSTGRRSPGIASLRRNPRPYRGRRHTVGETSGDEDMRGTQMIADLGAERPAPLLFSRPFPNLAPPPSDEDQRDGAGDVPMTPASPASIPQTPQMTSPRKRTRETQNCDAASLETELMNETVAKLHRTLSFVEEEGVEEDLMHPPKRCKIASDVSFISNSSVSIPRLLDIPVLRPPASSPPEPIPAPTQTQTEQTPTQTQTQPVSQMHNPQTPCILKPARMAALGVNPPSQSPIPRLSPFLKSRHFSSIGSGITENLPSTDISVSLTPHVLGGAVVYVEKAAAEMEEEDGLFGTGVDEEEVGMAPPALPYYTPPLKQMFGANANFVTPCKDGGKFGAMVVAAAASLEARKDEAAEKVQEATTPPLADTDVRVCLPTPETVSHKPENAPEKPVVQRRLPQYRVGLSKFAKVKPLHGYLRKKE